MTAKRGASSSVVPGGPSVDQRYASYVDVACSLDGLLWSNQATLLGITVLGWGAVGLTLEKQLRFPPFSHSQTLAVILILAACLYAITIVAKMRMRFWHLHVERELAKIEGQGYFVIRQLSKAWYLSAPRWSIGFFGVMAALMLGSAVVLLLIPSTARHDVKEITPSQAEAEDLVTTQHEIMDNLERRFRLRTADGNGYILTRSPEGGWQRSHSHHHLAETYVVEKGWMIFVVASAVEGEPPSVTKVEPGGVITSPVGRIHNVYLSSGSEIHTIKHGGQNGERDWEAAPEFDRVTATIPVDSSQQGVLAPTSSPRHPQPS